MSKLPTVDNEQGLRIRVSPWFKLKRQQGRHFMSVDLKTGFGFMPDTIIIERDTSRSNVIRVNAVLTDEENKKEDKLIEERRVAIEKIKKQIDKDKKDFEAKGGQDGRKKQEPAPKGEEGQAFEVR